MATTSFAETSAATQLLSQPKQNTPSETLALRRETNRATNATQRRKDWVVEDAKQKPSVPND